MIDHRLFGLSGRGGLRIAALVLFLATIGCNTAPKPIALTLAPATATEPATVRASGLSTAEVNAIRAANLDRAGWTSIFTVTVAGNESMPVAGDYVLAANGVIFTPRFPLYPGRKYLVRFEPRRLPLPRQDSAITSSVELPATAASPSTRVNGISPRGVWPENTLRFYIYFSAPMSRSSALEFVKLEDESGKEVREAFLPLDVELWNADRTRVTVFFDPGRVKRGIRPNVELGRALDAGRRYAIAVDSKWKDAAGQPLASGFRHSFLAGPAEERAVTPADWRIEAPKFDSRDALVVTFPWALDRGLLQRAIGVTAADGSPTDGDVTVDEDDLRWRFVPKQPWRRGGHALVVLTILEDPAGNRVGRPFEIEMFRTPKDEPRERVTVTFNIE